MKTQVFFSIIAFTILFCKISIAQSPVTAESIIKRYVELTGGAEKWESVNSIRFVLESKPANGKFLRNLTIKESPFKYYNKSSSHSISNSKKAYGLDHTEIYNNGIYINISGAKIDTVKDAKKLDEIKLQSYMLADLAYKKLDYKIDLIGITYVDGLENYEIRFESPNGSILHRYYNKQTGLLTMDKIDDGNKYVYTSYKKVQGFLIPNKFHLVFPEGAIEFTVKEFVFNEKINPDVFEL